MLIFQRNKLKLIVNKYFIKGEKEHTFRLTLAGAIKTVALNLTPRILGSKERLRQMASAGANNTSTKNVDQKIPQKILLGVTSRLLTLVATPFEVLRQLTLIPFNIHKAIKLGDLKVENDTTKWHEQHSGQSKPISNSTVVKIKAKIALQTLATIGKILVSPLTAVAMGVTVSITGAENSINRNSLTNKSLRLISHLLPKELSELKEAQNRKLSVAQEQKLEEPKLEEPKLDKQKLEEPK